MGFGHKGNRVNPSGIAISSGQHDASVFKPENVGIVLRHRSHDVAVGS